MTAAERTTTFASPEAITSLDVIVTRCDMVESRHRVHAAAVQVDAHDRAVLTLAAGDAMLPTWWRSCAKPFQLLPLLQSGHVDALGWGIDEVALSCASHGGSSSSRAYS